MRFTLRIASLALLVCAAQVAAQTPPCPPVVLQAGPLGEAEKLMIETSSDKYGCWVRDADGQLVFQSAKPPPDIYKRVHPQTSSGPGGAPTHRGSAPGASHALDAWCAVPGHCFLYCEPTNPNVWYWTPPSSHCHYVASEDSPGETREQTCDAAKGDICFDK